MSLPAYTCTHCGASVTPFQMPPHGCPARSRRWLLTSWRVRRSRCPGSPARRWLPVTWSNGQTAPHKAATSAAKAS